MTQCAASFCPVTAWKIFLATAVFSPIPFLLDWTLARAPRLNDKPGTGQIKVGYAGQGPGTQLARADFARFMLDQVASDAWLRKAPMLSN
jgi:hypothetical protein